MIGVIVAVTGSGEVAVVERVSAIPDITVVRRCADLAEAVALAQAGIGDVMLVSPQAGLDRASVSSVEAAGVALLGIADDDAAREQLRSLGVTVPEDDWGAALRDAVARRHGGDASPRAAATMGSRRSGGIIIAVYGTGGAPGRTTLAVNIAAELSEAGARTLVVDLDPRGAGVAAALGVLDESAGIAAVAHGAVSGGDAYALVMRHSIALDPRRAVLTGLSHPSRVPELSEAALEAVWPGLRGAADVVVVDLAAGPMGDPDPYGGPDVDAAARAALGEADVSVIVGSAEPPQLARLIAMADEVPGAVAVVNKVRTSVAGPRPEDAIATVLARHTSLAEVWPLPWDPHACDEALRDGRALVESAPRSALRRAIAALASALHADARVASHQSRTAVPH